MKPKLNQVAYTTKYVTNQYSWIAYVVHDLDDDWHFYGPEQTITERDAALLSIKEIIDLDKTILEVLDMPCGFEAYRNNRDDAWIIVPIKDLK